MAGRSVDVKLAKRFGRIHFSQAEVEILITQYRKICKNSHMDKEMFLTILQNTFDMYDDRLMKRIFYIFDKNHDGIISVEEWVTGLSVFLCGTLKEKIDFCFHVYNISSDDFISKDDMYALLKNRTQRSGEEVAEELNSELVNMIMAKMDSDKVGYLSLADYRKAVEQEPLLMEAFGPCLPDEKVCISFLALFKEKLPKWT